jgi:hypothetical protein
MLANSIKILFSVFVLLVISIPSYGQPVEKARERIEAFKKMRMLEILELSGDNADKFILRYNEYDKDFKERVSIYEKAVDELENSIVNKSEDKIINEKSQNVIAAQRNVHKLIEERSTYFKDFLTAEQIGKYLVFEKRFDDRLREMLVDNPKKGRQGGGFGPKNRR